MKPYWIILGLVILVVDQISKYLVVTYEWTAVTNSGVSFGLASHANFVPQIITGLVLAALSWSWVRFARTPEIWLLLMGGLSNWIDRFHYGGVVDWLAVPGTSLKNNIADYAIAAGLLWFIWKIIGAQHKA